jgi:hypothetical protein
VEILPGTIYNQIEIRKFSFEETKDMKKAHTAAMASILFVAALGVTVMTSREPRKEPGIQESSARAAVVDDLNGEVRATQNENELAAFKGLALLKENGLGTGAESWSRLELDEGRFALVEENTNIHIAALADGIDKNAKTTRVYMSDGKVWFDVSRELGQGEGFEVKTPVCAIMVRGTVFSVTTGESETALAVFKGEAAIRAEKDDGTALLDENGAEVSFTVSGGKAKISVEAETVSAITRSELTSEDWAPLRNGGESGPGGVYSSLRAHMPELVRSADAIPSSATERATYEGVVQGAFEIALGKTSYVPGGTIKVNVSGVPEEMLEDRPFVAVYAVGADHSEYRSWRTINKASGSYALEAPKEPGEYEVRGYVKHHVYVESTMAGAVRFVAEGNSLGAYKFEQDNTTYAPGGAITVNVSDVPEEILEGQPFVAVYAVGAEHNEYRSWRTVDNTFGSYVLEAPKEPGEYEVRGYVKDHVYIESTMAGTARFSVR